MVPVQQCRDRDADPHADPHLELAARVLRQEGAGQSLRKTFSQPLYGGRGGHLKLSEPADLSQAAICDEYTVGFTHTFTATVELLQ